MRNRLFLVLVLVLEIPTVKTGRQDSFSSHQSSGTNCYGGKSDSLFAAETQQIEHEHDDEHEHERTSLLAGYRCTTVPGSAKVEL
ncbi:MAG: hypothetical protein JO151_16650 [Verrucomicrobia bacterium]|nr:hypothetical protein [Verrucomicrobiota bacterium]